VYIVAIANVLLSFVIWNTTTHINDYTMLLLHGNDENRPIHTYLLLVVRCYHYLSHAIHPPASYSVVSSVQTLTAALLYVGAISQPVLMLLMAQLVHTAA
jgi:hypothetical protein